MLGPFNLFPFLKGWDYRYRTWTRTVNKGQVIEVERIDAPGWLQSLGLISDDCYGGTLFEFQGSDLELQTFELTAELANSLGATMQDPSGWVQRYYRPNPASTAGIYVTSLGGGMQGFEQPYVPTTIVKLFLDDESTQDSATVQLQAYCVDVTSPTLFIRSLRSVLGMPVILPIDPALLEPGREPLTLKGPLEKKEGK